MKPDELDDLLKKFYEGYTSLEEEQKLRDAKKLDEGSFEAALFTALESEKKIKRPKAVVPLHVRRGPWHVSDRFWMKTAAVFILLSSIAWFLIINTDDQQVKTLSVSTTSDQQLVVLPDSSLVTLNSNSSLEYAVVFGQERRIILNGEAYFEVARDENKPFVVVTGQVQTEVLGTSFNLRWDRDPETVQLEVTEGKVAFASFGSGLSERIFVGEGEGAVYHASLNKIERLEKFNPNLISWKTGILVFENTHIEQVLTDASHHFGVQFIFDREELKNCTFSGVLENPDLQEFLKALEYVLRIKSTVNDKTVKLTGNGC